MRAIAAFALGIGALSGCVEAGANRILEVEATGALSAQVFLDRNGNLTQDAGEGPVPGVAVQIIPIGGRSPVARLVSALTGQIVSPDLPVGDYEVRVENATIPDSLRLIHLAVGDAPLTATTVRLIASDTAAVRLVLSFPTVTARQARTMGSSRRVFVEGVALNGWTTFGDSTLHVADTSGVIRAIRVGQSTASAGQLVRVLGTTDVRDGQGILTDGTVFPVGTGQLPEPVGVTSAAAARADDGRLDARLVQVTGATILGAQTNTPGDVVLTVTDGSGLLDVVLDRHAGISSTPYVPGASLTVVGLLVPSGQTGLWQLKPRSALDLTVAFPNATIADARRLEAGRVVAIEGVALNAWARLSLITP
jgi:hypothetical protein